VKFEEPLFQLMAEPRLSHLPDLFPKILRLDILIARLFYFNDLGILPGVLLALLLSLFFLLPPLGLRVLLPLLGLRALR
jgi:hypothetical protein